MPELSRLAAFKPDLVMVLAQYPFSSHSRVSTALQWLFPVRPSLAVPPPGKSR